LGFGERVFTYFHKTGRGRRTWKSKQDIWVRVIYLNINRLWAHTPTSPLGPWSKSSDGTRGKAGEKGKEGKGKQRWGEDWTMENFTGIYKGKRAMQLIIFTRVELAREKAIMVRVMAKKLIMVLTMARELGEAMGMALGLGGEEWEQGKMAEKRKE
jgi:hypothetical protein